MADNVPKLGEIITGEAHRDAVHVAVAPLIAASILAPGAHVTKDGALTAPGKGIGVVDPFLQDHVKPGEKFYVFLYPGSAIGLRHVYRHPELDADLIRRETMEALRAPAVQFIEECAKKVNMSYRELMSVADMYAEGGIETDVDMNTSNASMDINWPKFWAAYELVTNKFGPADQREEPFNCTC